MNIVATDATGPAPKDEPTPAATATKKPGKSAKTPKAAPKTAPAKTPKTAPKGTSAKTAANGKVYVDAPVPPAVTASSRPPSALDRAKVRAAANFLQLAADPTRIVILLQLADGERYVGDLCSHTGQSQPATSHHLALMRHGRLIVPRREGKQNFYSLTDEGRRVMLVVASLIS
jgi:DNA-binding transcriptional ArsR family regulator